MILYNRLVLLLVLTLLAHVTTAQDWDPECEAKGEDECVTFPCVWYNGFCQVCPTYESSDGRRRLQECGVHECKFGGNDDTTEWITYNVRGSKFQHAVGSRCESRPCFCCPSSTWVQATMESPQHSGSPIDPATKDGATIEALQKIFTDAGCRVVNPWLGRCDAPKVLYGNLKKLSSNGQYASWTTWEQIVMDATQQSTYNLHYCDNLDSDPNRSACDVCCDEGTTEAQYRTSFMNSFTDGVCASVKEVSTIQRRRRLCEICEAAFAGEDGLDMSGAATSASPALDPNSVANAIAVVLMNGL